MRRRDHGFPEKGVFCERGGPLQKSLNRNIFPKNRNLRRPFPKLTEFINLTQTASLLALATAVPPHVVVQKEVAALAQAVFAERYPAFDRLARVFETSGIRTRYAVRPTEWYLS